MKNLKACRLILLLLCVFLWVFSSFAATPPEPVPAGRVVWIKGRFSAITPAKTSRQLNKLSVIYLNDTLVTDTDSQAQIVFSDNTLMTFKPNSRFLIDQYQFDPKKQKSSVGKYVMNLITGGFRTITGLVAKNNPDHYQVNTPVATIGVRGTDYAVYIDNKGKLFIGNYSGMPCVHNKKGNLCLDNKTRYASVSSSEEAPVPLSQQPDGFKNKLDIVPAQIAMPGGGGGPGQSSPSSGSFCIVE